MGYLGRRIGKSQDTATDPGDGTGGGLLDLWSQGYFQRQGNIFNDPGLGPPGQYATGGVVQDYNVSGTYYRSHIFNASGAFEVVSPEVTSIDYVMVAGGGGGAG